MRRKLVIALSVNRVCGGQDAHSGGDLHDRRGGSRSGPVAWSGPSVVSPRFLDTSRR